MRNRVFTTLGQRWSGYLRFFVMWFALAASGAAWATPDLVVNVTESSDPIVAGLNESYGITVINNGTDATGVVMTLTIPTGATFVSATPPVGDSCNHLAGIVTCNLNAINSSGSHLVTLVVTPLVSGTNTLGISTTTNEGDSNNTNNNKNIDTSVSKGADLATAITSPANASTVTPGQNYSYTVRATNNGPHATNGTITITDTLPTSGVTFVSASGTGWSCAHASGTVTCTTSSSLASGDTSNNITITVTPTAASGSTLTNVATVALTPSDGEATDPNSANNAAQVQVTVAPGSDLGLPSLPKYYPSVTRVGVTYTGSTAQTVAHDEVITFTIIPSFNAGSFPGSTSNQRLTITLDKNKWTSVGTFTSSPSFWSCSYASSTGTITCNHTGAISAIGDLPTLTFNAKAVNNGSTVLTDTLNANIAFTAGPAFDAYSSNDNSSLAMVINLPTADMSVTKSRLTPDGGVAVGNTVTFDLTVKNNSTLPSGGKIRVTDTLPPELRAAGATCANGLASATGWTQVSYTQATGVLVCEHASFDPSLISHITVTTQAVASSNGVHVNNTATVECVDITGSTCAPDVNQANNTYSLLNTSPASTFPVDPGVDLSITKTASPTTQAQGQPITYTVTVTNNGTSAVNNVTVADDILSAYIGTPTATWVNGSSSGSCTGMTTAATTNSQSYIRCNVGTLNAGASAVVTLQVSWFFTAGPFSTCDSTKANSNTASVSSDTGDPVLTNNSSTACVTITSAADIEATITSNSSSSYVSGAPVTYTLGVTNHGAGAGTGVQITTSALPANVDWLGFGDAASTSACTINTTNSALANYRKVICSVSDSMTYRVLSGGSPTATYKTASERTNNYTFRVRPRATGNLTVTATSSSTSTDPVSANNTASRSDTINPATLDLLVNDTDDVDPQTPGSAVVHTVRITNQGPSIASNLVATDTPPTGPTINSVSAVTVYSNLLGCSGTVVRTIAGACTGTSPITCTVGDLDSQESACYTLSLTSNAAGIFANSVSVTSTETAAGRETNATNNTVSENTTYALSNSILGKVYLDLDNDGVVDSSESGISGIALQLTGYRFGTNGVDNGGTGDDVEIVALNATTDASGDYLFSALLPGKYTVTQPTQPTGTTNGITNCTSTGCAATGTSTLPSAISGITINGSISSANNFGELPPPSVAKAFSPTSITSGGTSTLTITLTNNGTAVATLSAALVDTLPTNVVVAATPSVGGTCTGTKTATAGGSTVTYASGATIPANSSCTITVDVTSSTTGTHTNTIASGALQTNYGVNPSAASATLTVGALGTISGKVFQDNDSNGLFNGTDSGLAGVTVQLFLKSDGSYPSSATATTTTDASGNYSFASLSAGTYKVVEPTQPTGTNNGITTAGAITGSGTVGTVTAVTTTPSVISDIVLNLAEGVVASSAGNNFAELPPPSITKAFSPTSIASGGTSTLTITLTNTGTAVATLSADLVDTLPTNVVVAATPSVGGTCTGTRTAAAGGSTVTYASGGTIPASSSCTITVNVTSSTAGEHINTIAAGALQTNYGINPSPASATLTVSSALGTISGKVFQDNNNDGTFNGTDNGLVGVTVQLFLKSGGAYPSSATATTTTDTSGNYSFASLSAGSYKVVEPTQPAGTSNGITTAGSITGSGTAGTATGVSTTPSDISDIVLNLADGAVASSSGNNFAELTLPGVVKAFSPTSIAVNTTSTLTITLTNSAAAVATLTSVFTDTLPTNVVVATPLAVGGTCTGTKTAVAGGSTVTYASGATIPANGSCTITVDVTSATAGTYTNTINTGGLQTNYGVNPTPATDTLTVYTLGQISGKVFLDAANDGAFNAGADTPKAGETIELYLKSGGSYPATATATASTDANGDFSFSGLAAGTYKVLQPNQPNGTNNGITTAGAITGSGTAGTATAVSSLPSAVSEIVLTRSGTATGSSSGNNFAEVSAPPGVVKAFSPTTILPGGASTLTITLTNNGAGVATLSAALVDTLPTNVTIHTTPGIGGTCTGTKTAVAGGGTVTYASGATIPASSSCTITVSVTSSTAGTYTNTIPAGDLQTNYGVNPTPATADLIVAQVGSLSGFVYNDANNSGSKDTGEAGVGAAVTVTLSGTTSWGADICTLLTSCATTSNATTGAFSIANLPAGTYALTESQADVPTALGNNYEDGKETAGTVGGISSGTVNNDNFGSLPTQNRITGISLTAGNSGVNYLFGERLRAEQRLIPPVVRGYVWKRTNTTQRKPPEGLGLGLGGWTVKLLQGGVVICTQTTADDGSYAFTNLSCHTPANNFGVTGFPTGAGYSIEFSSPVTSKFQINNKPISDNTGASKCQKGEEGCTVNTPDAGAVISGLTLNNGDEITEQNLPIDPNGIVYRTDTGAAVPGVRVRFLAPGGAVVPSACMNGTPSDTTTDATGFYQFLLIPAFNTCVGAGNGTYTIEVNTATVASGFHTGVSDAIRRCELLGSAPLTVDSDPNPAMMQNSQTGHTVESPTLAAACTPTTTDTTFNGVNAAGDTSRYYLTFNINSVNSPGNVVNNNIPIRPVTGAEITMTKTTPKINVVKGELVPYTLTATSTIAITGTSVVDQIPPGFKYRAGSSRLNLAPLEPTVSGRTLTWTGLDFTAGEKKTFKMTLLPGTGVGEGRYTNSTWTVLASNSAVISNVASATVRIVPDPTFDCSDIIGKVFDDKNVNGYQDEGESGIANVRLATATGLLVTTDPEGRFHVTCAAIPQMDRGSNFFMKLDDRTLPSGYRVTTENPREVRTTRGKMVKLNFGAAIHRVIRLELSDEAFQADSDMPSATLLTALEKLPDTLRERPSVLRLAYKRGAVEEPMIKARLKKVRLDLEERWKALNCCYTLVFEEETFKRASRARGSEK